MVHNCNICNKNFKYESMLKRHLDRKTKCSSDNLLNTATQNDNTNNIINSDNTKTNSSSIMFNIINNKLSKTEVINILISLIGNNNIIDIK